MANRYKIIKASDSRLIGVIFEYAIIKDMGMPKWFKEWSETVYENKQPKWFINFVDKQFKPFTTKIEADVTDIKTRVSNLEVRMTKVENRMDSFEKVIKLNNLRTE